MLKILCVFTTALLLNSCSDFNREVGLKDDNPIEQAIEEMIKEETGIVVDFTPTDKNEAKK